MTSSQAESVLKLAKAELAAFLQAAQVTLGCRCPLLTGSAWIEIMLSLEWPPSDYECFFRTVTILTAIRLVSQQSGPTQGHPWQSAKQGENDDNDSRLTSA